MLRPVKRATSRYLPGSFGSAPIVFGRYTGLATGLATGLVAGLATAEGAAAAAAAAGVPLPSDEEDAEGPPATATALRATADFSGFLMSTDAAHLSVTDLLANQENVLSNSRTRTPSSGATYVPQSLSQCFCSAHDVCRHDALRKNLGV